MEKRMADVMVKDGCMRDVRPMNGRYFRRFELNCLVDGRAEIMEIPSASGKVLVYDADAKEKGRIPNRIATGWICTSGGEGFLSGIVLLVEGKHIEPEFYSERIRMRVRR